METGSVVFSDVAGRLLSDSDFPRNGTESTRAPLELRRSTDCERAGAEYMYDRGTIMILDGSRNFFFFFFSGSRSGVWAQHQPKAEPAATPSVRKVVPMSLRRTTW